MYIWLLQPTQKINRRRPQSVSQTLKSWRHCLTELRISQTHKAVTHLYRHRSVQIVSEWHEASTRAHTHTEITAICVVQITHGGHITANVSCAGLCFRKTVLSSPSHTHCFPTSLPVLSQTHIFNQNRKILRGFSSSLCFLKIAEIL